MSDQSKLGWPGTYWINKVKSMRAYGDDTAKKLFVPKMESTQWNLIMEVTERGVALEDIDPVKLIFESPRYSDVGLTNMTFAMNRAYNWDA